MAESNRGCSFSRRAKNYSADKSKSQYSDSDEEKILNVLSIRDQTNVIHEYNLKKPQPTVRSLARKYNVSSQYIAELLRNQKSIIKSSKSTVDETHILRTQRQEQLNFLELVMYEYLERTLYHNIPTDDAKFQKKAEEVKDCMAILKFKPSYAWLVNFKEHFGIGQFSMEALRKQIKLKDDKPNSLDPVDMVRYVQQRKDVLLKAQNNVSTLSNQSRLRHYSRYNYGKTRSIKDMSRLQLRKDNNPTIVYEGANESPLHSDVTVDGAIIKIEIGPTQLSEYKGVPQKITIEMPADPTTNDNQRDDSDDEKQTLQKSDVRDIILESESEDDEYLTVYEIIDDEAPSSPAADKHICSSPLPLSNIADDCLETDKNNLNETISSPPSPAKVDNDSKETDISPDASDSITIKTETPSNDDEPMETNDKQISTYILREDVVIKTEASPSPQLGEENMTKTMVFEKHNSTNESQISKGLAIDHTHHYSNTTLPPQDVLDEDIKPTIIFEKSEELIMNNNNGTNDHNPPSLATGKRPRSDSPLPDIDTLEEAMRHLKVLENYVMLKENFRAIGLITQLEDAIKKTPKK